MEEVLKTPIIEERRQLLWYLGIYYLYLIKSRYQLAECMNEGGLLGENVIASYSTSYGTNFPLNVLWKKI